MHCSEQTLLLEHEKVSTVLLLVTYIASLKAFRDKSVSRHGQWMSLDGRDKTLKFADEALEKSQDAEVTVLRQDNLIIDADATTETALMRYRLPRNTPIV